MSIDGQFDRQGLEPPRQGPRGRIAGLVICLLGLVIFGGSAYNIVYTAGFAGVPGTLTVADCRVEGGGRSLDKTVCSGSFLSDDGKFTDESAEISTEYEAGTEVAVQQHGDRYFSPGFRSSWGFAALACAGVFLAGVGVPMAATGVYPRSGRAAAVGQAMTGTRAALVMKYMLMTGAGGALLFGALALVS